LRTFDSSVLRYRKLTLLVLWELTQMRGPLEPHYRFLNRGQCSQCHLDPLQAQLQHLFNCNLKQKKALTEDKVLVSTRQVLQEEEETILQCRHRPPKALTGGCLEAVVPGQTVKADNNTLFTDAVALHIPLFPDKVSCSARF